MIHIVLFQPEIPPNTGNIARLCVCNDLHLHIIHPTGFSMKKKDLLRAGLDYWQHLDLTEHSSWEEFRRYAGDVIFTTSFFFTRKSEKSFWDVTYPDECYLVFGSETYGLPDNIRSEFNQRLVTIPMNSNNARCLNLSSSVAIAVYELIRRQNQQN